MDSSSEEGSKKDTVTWSLSSFVKPDPKPVEKFSSHSVPQVKLESTGEFSNNSKGDLSSTKETSFASPKCLNREQIKKEFNGNFSFI